MSRLLCAVAVAALFASGPVLADSAPAARPAATRPRVMEGMGAALGPGRAAASAAARRWASAAAASAA